MSLSPLHRLGPIAQLALGLAALSIALVALLGAVFDIFPDRIQHARQVRTLIGEQLARETVLALQKPTQPEQVPLDHWLREDWQIRSLGLRLANGRLVNSAGPHELLWRAPGNDAEAVDNARIAISAGNQPWGQLEIHFATAYPQGLLGWLSYPLLLAPLLLFGLTALAYYLYLRRSLEYLDPFAVIPERIRLAYDNFHESVLIVDRKGRIVLANEAFRALHPSATDSLNGMALDKLDWLTADLAVQTEGYPWEIAMRQGAPLTDIRLTLPGELPEAPIHVILGCTPVLDNTGKAVGCMVILSDVSALHQANERLVATLEELEISRQLIAEKNRELETQATRDPLTGCLNRRALFDLAEPMFRTAIANREPLSCIMCDIDFFKRFNDQWGHSVGDQVIISSARNIAREMRPNDLFCRYGGEEFCIFLPGMSTEQALAIGERLRAQIEHEAGRSIREPAGLSITMSFGVSTLNDLARTPEALIDQADIALYQSKRNGRNRCTVWAEGMSASAQG